MRINCPNCGQANRLPDTAPAGGAFVCGKCKGKLAYPGGAGSAKGRRFRLGRLPWWLALLTVPYALFLLFLSVMNTVGPERWWFTSFNLYMPQWVYAIPAAPLFLLYLVGAWRWAWLPALLGLWVVGPLMGLQWHPFPPAAGGRVNLRVMTYNVKWGKRNGPELAEEIRHWNPDVIQMQDANGVDRDLRETLAGWNVRLSGQYIVASRLPLSELEWVDIGWPGSRHHGTRARLRVGETDVTLFNVHFLSPRYGLVSVRHRDVEAMTLNAERRLIEAQRLAEAASKEMGPVILTGDLNAPDQSLVCRALFATGLRDVFSSVGNGYGYTYGRFTKIKRSYVRIDHILYSRHFAALAAQTGTDAASDHVPVIADLALDLNAR